MLHEAVREGLAGFLAETAAHEGGLPRFVEKELRRYLECGVLAFGFTRVLCDSCKDELLVAFSCKRRGVCPSCTARRATDTAARLVEEVLPQAPYRQWTFSLPKRVRWILARHSGLVTEVLGVLVRALFGYQRKRAMGLGFGECESGAVTFIQRFNSALLLNIHFHALVPNGVFEKETGRFLELPPPDNEEVELLLEKVVRRTVRLLRRRGLLDEEAFPEDGLQACQAASLQKRLPFPAEGPVRRSARSAFLEGFSLHANTQVHENDRTGLERLCRYGARGALSLERLSRREDGRLTYRMKRAMPDGSTHLVLTPQTLLRRLAALVPPPRQNLTRFHGVLAPHARLRPRVVFRPAPVEEPPAPEPLDDEAPASPPKPTGKSRVPWADLLRRSFGDDVLRCPCGGRRRVLAHIVEASVVKRILESLKLPFTPLPLASAQSPPQQAFWS